MGALIVHCPIETKTFLTLETREGGVVQSRLANLDGSPFQDDGVRYAGDHPGHVAIFLDTISGNHFAQVTPGAAVLITKSGGVVYRGCGVNSGLFVEAPDFTLNGRFGERSPKAKSADESAQVREAPKVAKFVNRKSRR